MAHLGGGNEGVSDSKRPLGLDATAGMAAITGFLDVAFVWRRPVSSRHRLEGEFRSGGMCGRGICSSRCRDGGKPPGYRRPGTGGRFVGLSLSMFPWLNLG